MFVTLCHFFHPIRTMNNSESGRKINQAVNNTSRAVGGALSQAKGAISSWWSAITTQPTLYNEDDALDKRNPEDNNIEDTDLIDSMDCNVMNVDDNDSKEEHFHIQENHGGVVEIGREAKFIDQTMT